MVDTSSTPVLVQPRVVLALGLLCLFFFGGFAMLSALPTAHVPHWFTPPVTRTEVFWEVGGFGLFTLLGMFLLTSYFLERHEGSKRGLTCRSIFGLNKTVEWSNLHSVRYCPYPRAWFRLQSTSGTVIRVSFWLVGLPDFARLLLHSAPDCSLDATTTAVLRAVAAGHPAPMRLN